jgi:hypothetical protein
MKNLNKRTNQFDKREFLAMTVAMMGIVGVTVGCGGGSGGGNPDPTPSPTPTPTATPTPNTNQVFITPETVGLDPGQSVSLRATVTNPPTRTLRYRWFIAAPAAYFVESAASGTPKQGTDIEVTGSNIILQTGATDSGKLTAHLQVFVEANGTRTLLGESSRQIELTDIRPLTPTWVVETAPNRFGTNTAAYFWEFPTVPGAKDYLITLTGRTGFVQKYRMLQGDLEATPVTTTPILTGNDPFPPAIPVQEEVTGVVRDNFYRRGNGVRMLVVWGGPLDAPLEEIYRTGRSMSVFVRF